jgi:two-component system OmpR family sensor kinase
MFASFARRLTGWYVVAAVTLVIVVAGAFAACALLVYVHLINDGIESDQREAQAYAARAQSRSQPFVMAAVELESRLDRPGIRMFAVGPLGHPPGGPRPAIQAVPVLPPEDRQLPRGFAPPRPTLHEHVPQVIVGSRVLREDPRTVRGRGNRIGIALNAAAGGRFVRFAFLDGEISVAPDPDATARVALWLLLGVLFVAVLTGLGAWLSGRFITSQVLRPLIDVTHALHRFATRDFTPQAITVAGKSEFDAIAVAYNAAAAQVALAFDERRQAETQMRQFVADAGHELRTPLTIVLGYIDLLQRRAAEGDERSRRIFTAIAAEGARMRTLIDNLVLLARLEGSDVRPTEPFALRPLVDEIVDARRVLFPELRIDLDLAVDARVIGNRDEIHEAIANVVDNAIKYAPGSPIRIAASQADDGIELTVADDGPGILAEDHAGIFDRFYRGATRGDVEGSGLGLPIAKRAVERAGGSLVLQSSSERGTVFAFRLRADQVRRREARAART